MVVERGAGTGLLVILVIGAACGTSPGTVGTGMDAGPNDSQPDTMPIDYVPGAFESGPIVYEAGPVTLCGNGTVDPSEECDDGNQTSGDGCNIYCQIECPASDPSCRAYGTPGLVCGDGILITGEACDDGNVVSGDGCSANCQAVEPGWTCPLPGHRCFPICGDGVVTAPETCDDGNQQSGDGCSSTCVVEHPCFATDGSPTACPATCGNGQIDGSEACDDGPANADVPGACSTTCHRLYYCGDGVVTPPEECDLGANNAQAAYDYTTAPGDGCSAVCTKPRYCGDGIVDSSFGEQCDLGSYNGQRVASGATTCVVCDTDCTLSIDCN